MTSRQQELNHQPKLRLLHEPNFQLTQNNALHDKRSLLVVSVVTRRGTLVIKIT